MHLTWQYGWLLSGIGVSCPRPRQWGRRLVDWDFYSFGGRSRRPDRGRVGAPWLPRACRCLVLVLLMVNGFRGCQRSLPCPAMPLLEASEADEVLAACFLAPATDCTATPAFPVPAELRGAEAPVVACLTRSCELSANASTVAFASVQRRESRAATAAGGLGACAGLKCSRIVSI